MKTTKYRCSGCGQLHDVNIVKEFFAPQHKDTKLRLIYCPVCKQRHWMIKVKR